MGEGLEERLAILCVCRWILPDYCHSFLPSVSQRCCRDKTMGMHFMGSVGGMLAGSTEPHSFKITSSYSIMILCSWILLYILIADHVTYSQSRTWKVVM